MGRNPLVRRLFPSRQIRRQRHSRLELERLEERSLLSLVAAYNFDAGSGSVLADVSGNDNNGTISNATWTSSGKYGGALVFNGTNSMVTINDSASLHLTTAMTLEAWVVPTQVSNDWTDVVYKGNDNYFLEATSPSGGVPAAGATLGSSNVHPMGTAALTTNTWAFLTETYNGSTLSLYVNGTLVSSLAETGNIATSTNPLQIGGDNIYGQYFQGLIDNVRIYNTALTAPQIQTDMNTAVGGSISPTVTSENPAPNAAGVATNTAVTATFNESVLASTVNTTNFTLTDPSGNLVSASVSYADSTHTATLTPKVALGYGSSYTATISGVTDAAGHTMANPFSWSFTTDPAPAVTTCSPAWNATGVAVSSPVTATFNEAVQSGTIGFTLTNPSGSTVAATVAYNSSTNTATLTPSAALANSTTYTATVSGVQDTAGDPMASPYAWTFTTAASTSTGASTEPLLYQSNLQYVGAFRVPDGTIGASSFSFGGSAIAFNPANNSLFAVGDAYDQDIAEITIPSSIVNSTNLNNLAVATVLQPFTSILPRIPNNPANMSSGGYEAIGGLMVDNGKLIGTAFNTYDASGSVTLSHFELSSLNLASASVSGLYQVGTMGGGFVGGYMMPVPSEWQSALGAPCPDGTRGDKHHWQDHPMVPPHSASTRPTSARESPRIYLMSIMTRAIRLWAGGAVLPHGVQRDGWWGQQ